MKTFKLKALVDSVETTMIQYYRFYMFLDCHGVSNYALKNSRPLQIVDIYLS